MMIIRLKYVIRLLILILLCSSFLTCSKESIDIGDNSDNKAVNPKGKVEIKFIVPDEHFGNGCVKRAELVIAVHADSLYQGKYFVSFNVSDIQEVYTVSLEPGSYYYQAAVICICETGLCSSGRYTGGQYGMKYTADKFYITENETTYITPQFQ